MTPEKIFETKIKRMLTDQGCYFIKHFANRNTAAGVPDILACVGGEFLGIEVKSADGHPSALQIHHVNGIRKAGGCAFIVYPSGYDQLVNIVERLKRGKVISPLLPIELK